MAIVTTLCHQEKCYAHRCAWKSAAALPRVDRRALVEDLSGGHSNVNILSYNPGHDGAIAYLKGAHLVVSIEAEKNSNFRYLPIFAHDVLVALGELEELPDVLCTGGWWPCDENPTEPPTAGYRGLLKSDVILGHRRFLGKEVLYFSSSHERSHLLCAFG